MTKGTVKADQALALHREPAAAPRRGASRHRRNSLPPLAEGADPLLRKIAAGLEETGWAVELCDADWRLVWVSSELRALLGQHDDVELGVGRHLVETRDMPIWRDAVADLKDSEWLRENVPQMLDGTPGGADAVAAMVRPEHAALVRSLTPRQWPIWTSVIGSYDVELGLGSVRYFGARVRLSDGTDIGTIYVYGSSLPTTLIALLSRGDRHVFERMARLVEPGRRAAAVLFADLESSSPLARQLPSPIYFGLIRKLMSALDAKVGSRGGIVGKHAGDGVTAFFLAEDYGGESAAAAAAISVAKELSGVVADVAAGVGVPEPTALRINVGIHWGETLYIGQVSTQARLEVTALGDEVNQCARIQQAARDGRVLGSKALVERLGRSDAAGVGIEPDAVAYRTLLDLEGVPEKSLRDAGTLPVTDLAPAADEAYRAGSGRGTA